MKVKDQETWQEWQDNNTDPYGEAIMSYAKRWAEMMEEWVEKGLSITYIAKETSRLADTEGITGFMHGAAVAILSSCWQYGEELRTWHNLDTQLGNEGEKANAEGKILNPVLLTVEF